MNETQKRISAYKSALPGLRERLAAVALLLALSLAMMTSATFAWLTISRAPEVTGVNTTVAANGNLEVALANSNSVSPGESQIGDSSAASGQTVTSANLTWGNLVNLSDSSYGLTNLTLRPAQLNQSSLLTSPLYGAVYGKDGRIEKLTSNFAYTAWVPAVGNVPGYFGLSNNLGVRAISSTKIEAVGFYADYLALKQAADVGNLLAGNAFVTITQNPAWMASLATMMGVHMTAQLNSEDQYKNQAVTQEDLNNLIDMYAAFINAFDLEAQALANLLNLELFLAYGGDTNRYTAYTASSVLETAPNSGRDFVINVSVSNANGSTTTKTVKLTDHKTFIDDYNKLLRDIEKLRAIAASGDYRWTASGLKDIINQLVNVNACIVDGKTVTALLNEFSSNITSAFGYMNKEVSCVITNGVLYNFEQRTGTSVSVSKSNSNGKKGLPVTAKMYVSTMNLGEQKATIYATITTSAEKPSRFAEDLTHADTLNTGAGSNTGVVTALDTYGLAVDLWVRTNASASYLILEGNVLTESKEVVATGKDANGNTVNLFTLARVETVVEDEDSSEDTEGTTAATSEGEAQTITVTYTLYKSDVENDDGTVTTTWYDANSYSEFILEDGETPTAKMETVVTVIGYKGENRVWNGEDKSFLTTDSTTQGSGSCYVYYADSPEDQARSLKLLEAFNVAFVDGNGELLAIAKMDTKRSYEDSGRVIVPLVLSNESIDLGADANGNKTYAITALEKNVPMRITAIVYLDGTALSNQEVLSAADIQGQLNIQFGSTQNLYPVDNEKLEGAERRVSASVSHASFDYDTATEPMTATVTVNVDGDSPATVTAFFIRQISATQGSRETPITFTKNSSGVWTADYTFTVPGKYILRTVQVDGQDYVLSETPTVTVTGFAIEYVRCAQATNNHISVMTAANSSTVDLSMEFATADPDKMPSSVQGRFLREDGTAVNINFVYNPTTQIWSGKAVFLSSGDYTLQYLVLDGEYMQLDASMHQTATVYLGMQVAIYTTSPTTFKYLPSEMTDAMKNLGMQVKIMDNTGAPLEGLTGARLVYGLQGSAIRNMNTNLIWDALSGYYIGELHTDASGIFRFSSVTVGENTITNATTAPTFTIISPEPPSYESFQKAEYQFAPDGNAKMNVKLAYSSTATVASLISDASGNEYEVQGKLNSTDNDSISEWFFTIPTVNAAQDGYWTMKEVRVWNFYDPDGNFVGAETDSDGILIADGERDEPLVFDMRDKEYTTKVVQTVTVSFAPDMSADFSGEFLQKHTISGLSVDIRDFENAALQNIGNVKLEYIYQNDSLVKGGYTSAAITNATADFTVPLNADSTGTHFVQSADISLQYAGTYIPMFSYTIDGRTKTFGDGKNTDGLHANTPVFTVSSETPTAIVTGVTPTGSNPTKITYSTDWKGTPTFSVGDKKTSEYSAYTATIYAVASADNSTRRHGTFTQPTISISVSGITNECKASLILPAGDASEIVFERTGNGSVKKTLGSISQIKKFGLLGHTLSAYYGHGIHTISTMTIVKDNITFTVPLDNPITINNPSSVNQS